MNYLRCNVLLTLFCLLFLPHSCIKIIKHHSQAKRTRFPSHISHKAKPRHTREVITQSWGRGLDIYFAYELFISAVNLGEGVGILRDLNGEQRGPGGKLMKTSEDWNLGDAKENNLDSKYQVLGVSLPFVMLAGGRCGCGCVMLVQ